MNGINVLIRRKYDIFGILDDYKPVPIQDYKKSINLLVSKGKIKDAWNLVRSTESFHIIADDVESIPLYDLHRKHFVTQKLIESTYEGIGDTLDTVVIRPQYTLERVLRSGRNDMGLIINAWANIFRSEFGFIPTLKNLIKYYNDLLSDNDSLAIETQKLLSRKNITFKHYALKYAISIPASKLYITI